MKHKSFYLLVLNWTCLTTIAFAQEPTVPVQAQPIAPVRVLPASPATPVPVASRKSIDTTIIKIIGMGDIQKSMDAGKEIPATTSVGAYFRKKKENAKNFKDIEVQLAINIASTVDSINAKWNETNTEIVNERDFGTSLLSPSVSRQSALIRFRNYFTDNPGSVLFRGLKKYLLIKWDGIQGSVIGANKMWSIGDALNTSAQISVISVSLGLFHELIPDEVRANNNMSITFALSHNLVFLSGDVGIPMRAETFRTGLIGTAQKIFYGVTPSLFLRLENIEAEASAPILFSRSGIDGFSHGQFVTTIRFIGGIPLLLKKINQ